MEPINPSSDPPSTPSGRATSRPSNDTTATEAQRHGNNVQKKGLGMNRERAEGEEGGTGEGPETRGGRRPKPTARWKCKHLLAINHQRPTSTMSKGSLGVVSQTVCINKTGSLFGPSFGGEPPPFVHGPLHFKSTNLLFITVVLRKVTSPNARDD